MNNKFDLTGKIAIVTGAAGLLGQEHCLALAETGALVIVTDINEKSCVDTCHKLHEVIPKANFIPYKMDVTDVEEIKQIKHSIIDKFGSIDILINNAAIDPKVKKNDSLLEESRLENFSLDAWNLQLNVGLTGAFLCSREFGTWMAQNGGGAILNISSDLSVIAPDQRIYRNKDLPLERQPVKPVTYSVIKSGLIGLTKYLASYWAADNVRVNALSPGGVFNDQPENFVKKLTNLIPMGRMAKKEEYRGCIQFLTSNASSYITGQNILAEGGRSIW